jgi:hypothetical protein
MLLQEVMRESKFRKTQAVVFKIDFEKPMIKLTKIFCLTVTDRKGFSDKWIVWIKEAVAKETLMGFSERCDYYLKSEQQVFFTKMQKSCVSMH